MAKGKLKDVVPKLVTLLERIDATERGRAIHAALLTLGGNASELPAMAGAGASGGSQGGGAGAASTAGGAMTAQAYFKKKEPQNKVEELAVAARYREEYAGADTSSKADLQDVVTRARLNFDARNFNRDIFNAKTAKLFNTGGGKDSGYMLSAYGQEYVEVLPDRTAVKALSAPKKRGRKKVKTKK